MKGYHTGREIPDVHRESAGYVEAHIDAASDLVGEAEPAWRYSVTRNW
jgi:hypothetical protein